MARPEGRWPLLLDLALDLDDDDEPEAARALPRFVRIARAISAAVRAGRLAPGAALPSSRALAAALGVHRNTVLAAYRELDAEGWTEARARVGLFVSSALPPAPTTPRARPRAAHAGFDLAPGRWPAPRDTIAAGGDALALVGGRIDLRLLPLAALARAYRRVLRGASGRALLDYGDPAGDHRLRAQLAAMLAATRGLPARPESLLVTRGSQMALWLAARLVLRPGDVAVVEALGYRPAWHALEHAGARVVPLPVDGEGLVVDRLAALLRRARVRLVYLTPHHQYPTMVTLSAPRRLQLLALARRHRIAVVEDDYDHEFHYEGRPVLPLAADDASGVVLYVGTLSKVLAPGLRLGFLHGAPEVVAEAARLRSQIDRQGDLVLERAVASLLEDGEVQRHMHRMRRVYQARRELLIAELRRQLGGALSFEVAPGGISLWARTAVDADLWAARARAHGVLVQCGRDFAFDGRARPYLRLGFARLDERELPEAVRRLARALPTRGVI